MKEYTAELLEDYKKNGWFVCEPIANEAVPLALEHYGKPVIIPLRREADLSPSQLRTILGLTSEDQIVSLHSGVMGGTGIVKHVAGV